jgi:simple sugar transport system ATP-binding protein
MVFRQKLLRLASNEIVKRFGHVVANDGISLSFDDGQVYALLGENGAGKTTYLNILFGMYRPEHGGLELNGKKVHFKSPNEAISHGIYLVQQNFSLIESFSVAENLALTERSTLGPLRLNLVDRKAHYVVEKNGLNVNPWLLVEKLPMSFRQRAEILKGLFCDAKILLLDEPTSVLGPADVEDLGKTLRALAADGRIVIFTSHKLEQVIRFSDHVTVLRNGRVVTSLKTSDVKNVWELAGHMVGEGFVARLPERESRGGDRQPILRVERLCVTNEKGRVVVDNVSINVHEGEILGVAGVAGNGQKEFAESLVGLRKPSSGRIQMDWAETVLHPRAIRKNGVGYIPEEGALVGVVPDFTIVENLSLTTFDLTNSPFLKKKAMEERADSLIKEFDVHPPLKDMLIRYLSGGNAHKVILARELSRELKLLVAYNPTKGLDVRATNLVYTKLLEKRNRGTGVVLMSEDLDEILQLSDRVAVMFEGRVMGIRRNDELNIQEIGRMMAGKSS